MNKDLGHIVYHLEGSPKNGFNRRPSGTLLELTYSPKDTTYRNKGVGRKKVVESSKSCNLLTPVERIKPMKPPEPYWNFWRAVFAGWLIRYPGKIFKGIGMFFLFIVFMVFMAVSCQEPF